MAAKKVTFSVDPGTEATMLNVDANMIRFQCPKCGQDLHQTIGLLRSNQRLVCDCCGVGINFDTAKLAKATEILQEAIEAVPNEITIKFHHGVPPLLAEDRSRDGS
jgi:transcription elongation factor Elf1